MGSYRIVRCRAGESDFAVYFDLPSDDEAVAKGGALFGDAKNFEVWIGPRRVHPKSGADGK